MQHRALLRNGGLARFRTCPLSKYSLQMAPSLSQPMACNTMSVDQRYLPVLPHLCWGGVGAQYDLHLQKLPTGLALFAPRVVGQAHGDRAPAAPDIGFVTCTPG